MALLPQLALQDVTVAVVTAVREEFIAVCSVLELKQKVLVPLNTNSLRGQIGVVNHKWDGRHVVLAVRLPEMGNNSAAIVGTSLPNACPLLTQVIMTGIAGAMPLSTNAENHVRLGDIVVSGHQGVHQYDRGKRFTSRFVAINSPNKPSMRALQAHENLLEDAELGERPWEDYIKQWHGALGAKWARPKMDQDVLAESWSAAYTVCGLLEIEVPRRLINRVEHPRDAEREERPDTPRIFTGRIASANRVQRNVAERRQLQDQFNDIRAVEMEASGIADACWHVGSLNYFIVRGTCDYCNQDKSDTWRRYAALIAACYTRAILEWLAPPSPRFGIQTTSHGPITLATLATAPPNMAGPVADAVTAFASHLRAETEARVKAEQELAKARSNITTTADAAATSSTGIEAMQPGTNVEAVIISAGISTRPVAAEPGKQASEADRVAAPEEVLDPLVSEHAAALAREIKLARDTRELRRAFELSAKLKALVDARAGDIERNVLSQCYEEIAQVTVIRARTSEASGSAQLLHEARLYIEKARNVGQ